MFAIIWFISCVLGTWLVFGLRVLMFNFRMFHARHFAGFSGGVVQHVGRLRQGSERCAGLATSVIRNRFDVCGVLGVVIIYVFSSAVT